MALNFLLYISRICWNNDKQNSNQIYTLFFPPQYLTIVLNLYFKRSDNIINKVLSLIIIKQVVYFNK